MRGQVKGEQMKVRTFGAVLLVAILGLVAACGGNSQENALEDLCNGLTEVEEAVQGIVSLDPETATRDDLEDAINEARAAGDRVVEVAQDLEEANADALSGAIDDFRNAVSDLPDDTSLQEGITAAGGAFLAITDEVENIESQNCSESATSE